MRPNRKIPKKMSVVAANTMRFGAIVVFLFVMVILNLLASSSCTQLMKAKGEKERKLAQLDEARMRESTRWEEMKTPEKLELALKKHGLDMNNPAPEQVIKMLPNGKIAPRQLSVVRALRRNAGSVSRTVQDTTQQRALAPKRAARKVVR